MLKTQVMTMMMMKSSQSQHATAGKPAQQNGHNEIFTLIYSMMLMSFVEWCFKHLPAIGLFIKQIIELYLKKKNAWMPKIPVVDGKKEIVNSITMLRTYAKGEKGDRVENVCVEKADAVLDYLCSLDAAQHLKMDVRYTLNNNEEIELTPLLKAKVNQKMTGEEPTTEISVYSTILKISEIRAWIDDVHSNYIAEKNNKLGNKIYFFNELPYDPPLMPDMRWPMKEGNAPPTQYKWDSLPKYLTFNMNEFKTSKSFGNVYGEHVAELKERLDLFVNHPEWYMDRGIPHSLGILLHGIPGGGKTSTIKAIAKDTHRHIFNLSLRPYTTQRQLMNLFYNENVTVNTHDGGKLSLKIPLNKRVYVIEDIDCLTDVVLDRAKTGQVLEGGLKTAQPPQAPAEGITLSFLLNLLDGVLETPGRILIITSNFPEKLDKALVRPGRIDVKIEFGYASREFIKEMLNKFYDAEYSLDEIPDTLENIFTPAEVMESMCANFKSPEKALLYLVKKVEAKEKALANALGTPLEALGIENAPLQPENTVIAQPDSHKKEKDHATIFEEACMKKGYISEQELKILAQMKNETTNITLPDNKTVYYTSQDLAQMYKQEHMKKGYLTPEEESVMKKIEDNTTEPIKVLDIQESIDHFKKEEKMLKSLEESGVNFPRIDPTKYQKHTVPKLSGVRTWECDCNWTNCANCKSNEAAAKQEDAKHIAGIVGSMEQANNDAMPPQIVEAPNHSQVYVGGIAPPHVSALNDPFMTKAQMDDLFAIQDLKGIEEPTYDVMTRFNEMMADRR